jgi:hypothetical protein
VIEPVRKCHRVISNIIYAVANAFKVQVSDAVVARKVECGTCCHSTVTNYLGSECWLLVRKLILNESPTLLTQFHLEIVQCQKVDVVQSCFTLAVCKEGFQAVKNASEGLRCTYICVTKQEGLHLLSEHLKLTQVTSPSVDATALPFPPNPKDLVERDLIGEKVIEEYHPEGSRVCVIGCPTCSSDKGGVKCTIEDHSSGLYIAVGMLVLSGTYSFSRHDANMSEKTMVITSLDEFQGFNFVSASPGSQTGIMYYVLTQSSLKVQFQVGCQRTNSPAKIRLQNQRIQ